ncbi:MAG: hypothetical protein ACI35O_03410 [Bacillaceae bacterium]
MKKEIEQLIIRKSATTFFTTTIFSLLLGFLISSHDRSEFVYNQGNQFFGWFFIFFVYSGAIILLYGNTVSIVIEYLQRKWFQRYDWLYVLILGIFGLASGIFFQERTLALYGMLTAVLFAIIDKWLYRRQTASKGVKMFFIIPIVTILLSWGYLQLISPPMPPFTKEDAVEFATSGNGTTMDHFPKELGKSEIMIKGYQITRETSVKEIKKEVYVVTFTENWKKGNEEGFWSLSYTVERGSLTANGQNGNPPPYYEGY